MVNTRNFRKCKTLYKKNDFFSNNLGPKSQKKSKKLSVEVCIQLAVLIPLPNQYWDAIHAILGRKIVKK